MKQQSWSVVLKTVLQPSQEDAHSWNIKRNISQTSEMYSLPGVPIQSHSLANANVPLDQFLLKACDKNCRVLELANGQSSVGNKQP